MGCEQVFNNLTFKRMDALRKQIQFLIDYVFNYSFGQLLDTCNHWGGGSSIVKVPGMCRPPGYTFSNLLV